MQRSTYRTGNEEIEIDTMVTTAQVYVLMDSQASPRSGTLMATDFHRRFILPPPSFVRS
jgi:hypothetical protein